MVTGAKNRDIMMIFLLNSAIVGGTIGVILGSVASSFLSFGEGRMSMSGFVTSELMALDLF